MMKNMHSGLTSWVLGNCTQACGGGQLTKTRKCVDIDTNNTVVEPMHCGGVAMESLEECNTHRCTGECCN